MEKLEAVLVLGKSAPFDITRGKYHLTVKKSHGKISTIKEVKS